MRFAILRQFDNRKSQIANKKGASEKNRDALDLISQIYSSLILMFLNQTSLPWS